MTDTDALIRKNYAKLHAAEDAEAFRVSPLSEPMPALPMNPALTIASPAYLEALYELIDAMRLAGSPKPPTMASFNSLKPQDMPSIEAVRQLVYDVRGRKR